MRRAIDPEYVIGCIYEAVSDARVWNTALEAARKTLKADAVLLVYGSPPEIDLCVVGAIGFDQEALEKYSTRFLDDDPLIRSLTEGPPGVVAAGGRILSDENHFRAGIFPRLLQPSGLSHFAGVVVLNSGRAHAALWLARSAQSSDFSESDFEDFSGILAHFSRAMSVYHRLRRAELRSQMTESAFDRLAVGVVLLDGKGAPVMCNREAERIARKKDGFALVREGPLAGRQNDTRRLRDVIGRVASATPEGSREGAGTLRLVRPSGRSDLHVVVLPLPKRAQPKSGNGTTTVLFVIDPEKPQGHLDMLFGDLYGLTEAESRLVTRLLKGGGLPAAALKLDLSRNTVHSQLSSVFLKTNTRSQSELLTLLLTSVAPVEPPDEASGYNWPSVNSRDPAD